MLVALEIEHAVDHVLEHLRPRDGALLVDVADHEHRDPLSLRQLHERHRAVLHLPDAARRRIQLLVIERLDRVDDQDVGLFLLYALKNISQASLGQDEQPRALNLQALGAELELVGRLLTGDIQHLRKLPQTAADLEHQRRLADARRAAHEHERALDRSAAENAVELTHAG